MAKEDTNKPSPAMPDPGQMFGSTSRTDAPDTAPSNAESSSVTQSVTSPFTTSGMTEAPRATEERVTGDVELYLAYQQDQFRYGEGDDDVLTGKHTKKFSRDEADRILSLARMSNLQVLERKPEDAS